ncbi:cysteine hydrolase family protein [Deinococcus hopiensis]|uniref:Nicotinamidase-related amidase n=1 Tax=Deinococcus hopiensis KR-140 TaxID=695939 RepID=A0A1W1VVJ3_9DEIO|nr:cysteine hydrolase family protein [Deinococcus hopiensis]SMB97397.1 Nicotinamidase-related amidase [Deinococcus hopiensis KR-140]
MLTIDPQTALVLIDVQQGFDAPSWGMRNNPHAEERIAELLEAWRQSRRPIWHVQHISREPNSPLRPGQDGVRFKPLAEPRPGETVIQKHVNSAFIGTDLKEQLRAAGVTSVVITGLTTDHCVSTTTRMAGNLGFRVLLPEDATATFGRTGPDGRHFWAHEIHGVHLASLNGEFATVTDTASVLAALGPGL